MVRLLNPLVLLGTVGHVQAIIQELFSTNAICRQRYCINPVFPGLQDLGYLASQQWVKFQNSDVTQYMQFCSPYVTYDTALTSTSFHTIGNVTQIVSKSQSLLQLDEELGANASAQDMVVNLETAAIYTYFYHLNGMGLDAWDFSNLTLAQTNPLYNCAVAIQRMVCYTYFPVADPSADYGMTVNYLRPCSKCCQSYIQACGVQCCDESTACSWTSTSGAVGVNGARQTQNQNGTTILLQKGYVDATAASYTCTGGAAARSGLAAVALAMAAVSRLLA